MKRDELECIRCGEGRPRCLDFHHTGKKDLGVSQMVNHGYGKERIREEIDECVVLCANCHRKDHHEGLDSVTVPNVNRSNTNTSVDASSKPAACRQPRAWLAAYERESDGCIRCATSDPACLDFHHLGEKVSGIAQMVSRGRPLAAIRTELEKCELLCANCHRIEHIETSDPAGE